MEVYHKDFDNFLFVKQKMVLINKEDDEEGIFETTSQFEEGAAQRLINTYKGTEISSQLKEDTKNIPSVIIDGCTNDSENVVEL